MLATIAHQARDWCRHIGVELALVAPVRLGQPVTLMVVAIGDRASVSVRPATVFRAALCCGADAVVVVHNHPSGSDVSESDRACTRRLVAAGAMLDIPLAGHLVLVRQGWIDCVRESRPVRPWADADAA